MPTATITTERLNTEEAAKFLGLDPQTLINWRSLGRGPAFIRLGRAVRYSVSALEKFIAKNTVTPQS